jgi:hypothetical protein
MYLRPTKIFAILLLTVQSNNLHSYYIEAVPPSLYEERRDYSQSSIIDPLVGLFSGVLLDKILSTKVSISDTEAGKKICLTIGNVNGYYDVRYDFFTGDRSGDAIVLLATKYQDEIIGKSIGQLYIKARQIETHESCSARFGVLLLAQWVQNSSSSVYFAFNGGEDVLVSLRIGKLASTKCSRTDEVNRVLEGKRYNFICILERSKLCGKSAFELENKSGPLVNLNKVYKGNVQIQCK